MSVYKYVTEVLSDGHLSLEAEAVKNMNLRRGEKVDVILLKDKVNWHRKLCAIRDNNE